MIIRVKLFAAFRELARTNELSLEAPDGATVGEVASLLQERFPGLAAASSSTAYAVNRRYVTTDSPLADGDELVMLPPVAGGESRTETDRFVITDQPIDPDAVVALVENSFSGAIVQFQGIVRERSNSGRVVTHLEYEAYPEMAKEQMRAVAREIEERWGITDVAISHRVGRLGIGDIAVSIAVSSPHRKAAFLACEFAIDRLKDVVPIWKKEFGPDGTEWVE